MSIAEQLLRLAIWRWSWGDPHLRAHPPIDEDHLRAVTDGALHRWKLLVDIRKGFAS